MDCIFHSFFLFLFPFPVSFPSFRQLGTFQAHQATHIIHQISHADPKSRPRKTNASQHLVAHAHFLRSENMFDAATHLRLHTIIFLLLLRQRFVAITLLANLRLVSPLLQFRIHLLAGIRRVRISLLLVKRRFFRHGIQLECFELLGESPDRLGVGHVSLRWWHKHSNSNVTFVEPYLLQQPRGLTIFLFLFRLDYDFTVFAVSSGRGA